MGTGTEAAWIRRRMRQLMELTVATGAGLSQGEARWMDDRTLNFWCPEQLEPQEIYRIRVDLGALGASVDVEIRVMRCVAVRSRRGGSGFLHGGSWEPVDPEALPRLLAALTQNNPAWARRAGRLEGDEPSVASQPSLSSVLIEQPMSRAQTSQALRRVLQQAGDDDRRGAAVCGQPVQVSVLGASSPRVLARFARSSLPGRYLRAEPGGRISCHLPCHQDLRPGEGARVTLGLPGRRIVRGDALVRGAGKTWVDLVMDLSSEDRDYLLELIAAAGVASRQGVRAARQVPAAAPAPERTPLRSISAGLPTAELSASGPSSLFLGYESWSAVEDSVDYDGRGVRLRLEDPQGGWSWRELTVLLSLPDGLFIQFPARAVKSPNQVTVVSTRLPAGQALIALLQRARRGSAEPAALRWQR